MSNPYTVERGFARDYPFQCKAQGGLSPAIFNVDDILAADFYPLGFSVSACSPTTVFYTANSTQDGYGQGQVSVRLTVANSLSLQMGTQYILKVRRALASAPTAFTLIVKKLFDVRDSSQI